MSNDRVIDVPVRWSRSFEIHAATHETVIRYDRARGTLTFTSTHPCEDGSCQDVLGWFMFKTAACYKKGTLDHRRVLASLVTGTARLSDLVTGLLLCAEEHGVVIDGRPADAARLKTVLHVMQGSSTG